MSGLDTDIKLLSQKKVSLPLRVRCHLIQSFHFFFSRFFLLGIIAGFSFSTAQGQVLGSANMCPTGGGPTTYNSTMTTYTLSGIGACGYPSGTFDPNYYGAIAGTSGYGGDYQQGEICGACVAAHYNSNSVTVMIIDNCGTCTNTNQLDLGPTPFQALTGNTTGNYTITWNFVPCPTSLMTGATMRDLGSHGSDLFIYTESFRPESVWADKQGIAGSGFHGAIGRLGGEGFKLFRASFFEPASVGFGRRWAWWWASSSAFILPKPLPSWTPSKPSDTSKSSAVAACTV